MMRAKESACEELSKSDIFSLTKSENNVHTSVIIARSQIFCYHIVKIQAAVRNWFA